MKSFLTSAFILIFSFAHVAIASDDTCPAVSLPSVTGTAPQADLEKFLSLIERFSNLSETAAIEKDEGKVSTTIDLLSKVPADFAAERGIDLEKLIKQKQARQGYWEAWHTASYCIYRKPAKYPVNIKRLSATLQGAFIEEVNTEKSLEEMEGAFEKFSVIPLRDFRYDKLVLGCGNRPTKAAGLFDCSLSCQADKRKHYDESMHRKDGHPETDTVDISAAMNPTLVGDVLNFDGVFDYIESLGKKYDSIFAEASPYLGDRKILDNIRKILNMHGTYSAGPSDFSLAALPESLRETSLGDVFRNDSYAIPVYLPDDVYARISDSGTPLSGDVSAILIAQIQAFFDEAGFEFVPTLSLVYSEAIDYWKTFEFKGKGRLIIKRIR